MCAVGNVQIVVLVIDLVINSYNLIILCMYVDERLNNFHDSFGEIFIFVNNRQLSAEIWSVICFCSTYLLVHGL